MKRIFLKPIIENELLSYVIEYYANDTVILLELSNSTAELKQLHDPDIKIPTHKREYTVESELIAFKLNANTMKKAISIISEKQNYKNNIGAIQIMKEDKLLFLSGDNFHPECISFLPIKENEDIINHLIITKIAKIIFGSE